MWRPVPWGLRNGIGRLVRPSWLKVEVIGSEVKEVGTEGTFLRKN